MMINTTVEDNVAVRHLPLSDVLDVMVDHNGNDQQLSYVRMMHETSPDPDSLSMVSDYSVMGLQIKQSITFSDMIMSTYSDLKNPNKSITVAPKNNADPDMIFRKYNMLSLAMEFSKWKESNVDLTLGESISDSESRHTKEDYVNDTTMVSCSPSILSDFSNMDQYFESHDEILNCGSDRINKKIFPKSPLQAHIDQKFEETFSGNKSNSESESEKDNGDYIPRSKIVRPAWAQSIFHRETLMKMPKSIRQAAESIRNFDLSKEKYLKMLKLPLLQLIVNGLMTQIEELNECLVGILIIRDELKSEQASMVVQVEELTLKARSVAQNIRGNCIQNNLSNSSNYGIVHRFLSTLKCSPKFTSNRVLSFFTQSNVSKIPPPEFV